MGYDSAVVEKGVTITAFGDGASVAVGVLETVSTMPARHISRLISDIESVHPGKENTDRSTLSGSDILLIQRAVFFRGFSAQQIFCSLLLDTNENSLFLDILRICWYNHSG
jgi:hypothetical protein